MCRLASSSRLRFDGVAMKRIAVLLVLVFLLPALVPAAPKVAIVNHSEPGRATKYGLARLQVALKEKGVQIEGTNALASVDWIVVLHGANSTLVQPESLLIVKQE